MNAIVSPPPPPVTDEPPSGAGPEAGDQRDLSHTPRERLVIVSNRVADLRATTQTGGLAVAVADAVK